MSFDGLLMDVQTSIRLFMHSNALTFSDPKSYYSTYLGIFQNIFDYIFADIQIKQFTRYHTKQQV